MPTPDRTYPVAAFAADAEAAGLVVDNRFESYQLRTGVDPDYAVWLLSPLSARTRP